ncbi:TolC family protein [Odoribacter sp. Z80]|uniref:TolC family protein n=1 Tax=Odoribacter sp. Z80 TaxID=2304575 RepID=UPI001379FE20|nr:TolC family protein [Odoribacter sp. Z80]NCE71691.1 TolC family protein [Odoribacter sp. Z80]
MKRNLYILILCFSLPAGLFAQSTVSEVLNSIELHNKTIQAGQKLKQARQLENRTNNNLANPTVELNQLWAKNGGGKNANELAVVQSFDFPSAYIHRNKLIKSQNTVSDLQYASTRQEILLAAQQTCLEIIYLQQQKRLLERRLKNTALLTQLYQKRLESGDANQLEYNKILLEKINAENASRLNTANLQAQSDILQQLNGGVVISFSDSIFPILPPLPEFSQLEAAYLAADPKLNSLAEESRTAEQEIKVNRALSLPKFDIGYRRNGGSEEKMNGFKIGMSIPLWESKNTVKQAKAQAEYANAYMEDNTLNLKITLQQLYGQAQALEISRKAYQTALSSQQNELLLNKALEAGQISMLDYFVEINMLYESIQNYLDIEKEYQTILAQLFQYTL